MIAHATIERELALFVTNSGLPPEDVTDALTLQAAAQTVPRLLDLARAVRSSAAVPVTPMSSYEHATEAELGTLLREHGSDKSTGHNYHLFYSSILGPRRTEALNVFEVGLGSNHLDVTGNMGECAKPGASLRAFRDFLPRAHVYGADIDRRILFTEDRIKTYFVDQTDPASFGPLELELPALDLIIDDGLHCTHTNLATAAFAVRKLRSRGWLVVEDIRESSLPIWHLAALILPRESWRTSVVAGQWGWLFVAERV